MITSTSKLKLYIVRHGRTEYNAQGVIQGQLDIPLNDFGRQQAQDSSKLFARISFDKVWSSTLTRARETAQIISQHQLDLAIKIDARLQERGLGSWEGTKNDQIEDAVEPADAETYESTTARLVDWLSDLLSSHHWGPDENRVVLVVTHEDCITSLGRFIRSTLAGMIPKDQFTGISFELNEGVEITDGCPNLGVSTVEFTPFEKNIGHKGTVFEWAQAGPV